MTKSATFALATVLVVAALLLTGAPAHGWVDLGHGLALDPGGRVVELASLPECQELAAGHAKWSP